jgi:hypothetical protein
MPFAWLGSVWANMMQRRFSGLLSPRAAAAMSSRQPCIPRRPLWAGPGEDQAPHEGRADQRDPLRHEAAHREPSRSISERSSAVANAIIRRAVSAIVGPNSPLEDPDPP